jgi:transcriptional regulator with XRE-family HTH domain
MLRKWRGYTQKKLADRSGVSVATIIKIERYSSYDMYIPKYTVRRKLCNALDVSVSGLFPPIDNKN